MSKAKTDGIKLIANNKKTDMIILLEDSFVRQGVVLLWN